MIQYYITKIVKQLIPNNLVFKLKATLNSGDLEFKPKQEEFEVLNQVHESPIVIASGKEISGDNLNFRGFGAERITDLDSTNDLRILNYSFGALTSAFMVINPKDEDGSTMVLVKNGGQNAIFSLISYRGEMETQGQIDAVEGHKIDISFARVSPSELILLLGDETYTYELFFLFSSPTHDDWNSQCNNLTVRRRTGLSNMYVFTNLTPESTYYLRIRGKNPSGVYTDYYPLDPCAREEMITIPPFGEGSGGNPLEEFAKVDLTEDDFRVISYPSFDNGLEMVGINYNNDQWLVKEGSIGDIFANKNSGTSPLMSLESFSFNAQSSHYPNFLTQIQTNDLELRSELELDEIDNMSEVIEEGGSQGGGFVGSTRPEPVRIDNVAYGSHSRQEYNIYLPTVIDENTKVIVHLHGGGMTSGDKDHAQYEAVFVRYMELMPTSVIVTSNYRYKGNGVYVNNDLNNDIQDMLNHTKNEFGLPYNYFLTGLSAGGTLSYHAIFRGSFPIKAIAPIAAPWDYTDVSVQNIPDLPAAVADTVDPSIDKMGMSEALYASPKTFSKEVPMLVIMGTNDTLVPIAQLQLIKDANANNPHFEFHEYNGTHTSFIHSPPYRTIIINMIDDFTTRYN